MIQRLMRYLLGYCVIEVRGLMPEKCINIMLSRGVPIWNIRRIGACVMRAAVSFGALPQARDAGIASGCEIVEKRKRGLPYIGMRMWHRKALLLGCVIILAGCVFTTQIVWTVEIEGEDRVAEEDIRRVLTENGLTEGAWIPDIDRNRIEDQLLLSMPDIAWAGLQIDGVNATMKVVETVPVPYMEDLSQPRDIIAARAGLIERMIVLDGLPLVQGGDYVAKGQVLVSGTIVHENGVTRQVHAMAEVWIKTFYTDERLIPAQVSGLIPTGESARVFYFINREKEKEKRIAGRAPDYPLSSMEDASVGPVVFGWQLIMRQYREMEREKIDPAEWEETLRTAERETYAKVIAAIPPGVKIIDKMTRYDMISDGGVRLSVWVQVMEDIALPVDISG